MARPRSGVPKRRVSLLIDRDVFHWFEMRQRALGHASFTSYLNVLLSGIMRAQAQELTETAKEASHADRRTAPDGAERTK